MIIPMRIASTRLPGKQHALIGGRPLIYHVLDHALKSKVRPIYIACDDQKHFNLIKEYGEGIEAIMTSLSHQSGSDRIFEAYQILEQRGEVFDFIINLQGDMPFFDPEIIDTTLGLMESNPQFDIGTCAVMSSDANMIESPSNPKVVRNMNGQALYFSRSVIPYQTDTALLHVGIYAYRSAALRKFVSLPQSTLELTEKLEQLRALENGMTIGVCIVKSTPISVDTEKCLESARAYYDREYGGQA
jgi:3-deoxy-manno-octulosonate cytidylyltransferase (CMP-KDO synthetase)